MYFLKRGGLPVLLVSGLLGGCGGSSSSDGDLSGEIIPPSGALTNSSTTSGGNTSVNNLTLQANAVVEPNPFYAAPAAWYEDSFSCAPKSLNWSDVNDWFYQLQTDDYETLADSKYDLLVLDGDPVVYELNRNVVERLKCGGDGDKFLVSYLSVGQAENYRDYWQTDWGVGNPSWIAYADDFWIGDFYVRYWDPEWQNILFSRVDDVVDKGFDGLYLDVIDAYEFFESERGDAREDMRALIATIADRARTRSGNPDFGIFVQNAEELIQTVGPIWIEPLTGIGKEEPFYWATDDKVQEDQRFWNDLYLGQWVAAGKLVLSVDYVTKPEFIEDAYALARQHGFVPLTLTQIALDQFEIVPGQEPD